MQDTAKLTYDVYFGTTDTPILLQSGVNNMYLQDVTVTSGQTYYWMVVTKDAHGNSANSGIWDFNVN